MCLSSSTYFDASQMSVKISTHRPSLRALKSYSSVTRKYNSTHTYNQPKKPAQSGHSLTIAAETKPTTIRATGRSWGAPNRRSPRRCCRAGRGSARPAA